MSFLLGLCFKEKVEKNERVDKIEATNLRYKLILIYNMNIFISYLAGVVVIFLSLIEYIIIIEVILSWLVLFGLQVRIHFFLSITQPIYKNIRKIIPTTLGPIDFAPMIVLIIVQLLLSLLIPFTPTF